MTTAAEYDAALAAKVEALGSSPTRLASDLRVDLEKIPPGATRYQVVLSPVGDELSGNEARLRVASQVQVHHYLNGPERSYTVNVALADRSELASLDWWRTIPGVFEIDSDATVTTAIERTLHVVSWTAQLEVILEPSP